MNTRGIFNAIWNEKIFLCALLVLFVQYQYVSRTAFFINNSMKQFENKLHGYKNNLYTKISLLLTKHMK